MKADSTGGPGTALPGPAFKPPGFRLLIITDRNAIGNSEGINPLDLLVRTIEKAVEKVPPGTVAVMVREKDLPGATLLKLVLDIRKITERSGVMLLVNDRVDVAKAAGAHGVHLPSSGLSADHARLILGEDAIIGVSTHSVEEAEKAALLGADYVSFGPVYYTPSKRVYGKPVGLEALKDASRIIGKNGCPLPVTGLGGISPDRASEVLAAGASGIACIRAVLSAEKPGDAALEFLEKMKYSRL